MATAILDIKVNEGDTFIMTLDFWENADHTIPSDLTGITYAGQFKIGNKYIPMTNTKLAENVIEFKVASSSMKELGNKGTYDIDEMFNGETFRILQGDVRTSAEVTA